MRFSGQTIGIAATAWCALASLTAFAADPKPQARKPGAVPTGTQPATGVLSPSPQALEFFETRIRPVLAAKCYACHGEKVQQAGLRLDSPAAIRKNSDAGHPAVVPGEAEKSALIQAVRYAGAIKMPPAGKLPEAEIQALTDWVKMGAAWPESGKNAAPQSPEERAKNHWAFQPVREPVVPGVKLKGWVKTPLDAFVLARLEARGLKPNPPADRRTLIRRASYDLTGLPPTAQETDAFVNDRSPDSWARVVDRLLSSPRYGERWARFWLDVARYADTKGYVFQEERAYAFAYTYRDWVVRALNGDMPYDQFLVRQIAADQLPQGEDRSDLAAMGFLTLGRRFLNNQPDIIDDRMDVIFRGTQALTVGCARCHDHKFDPIPQKDYYSLYGVFASSVEPQELPLLAPPMQSKAYQEFEKELKTRQEALREYRSQEREKVLTRVRGQVTEYLLAAHEVRQTGNEIRMVARSHELSPVVLTRFLKYLDDAHAGHHRAFTPWHLFSDLPADQFGAKTPEITARIAANADATKPFNPFIVRAFGGAPPKSLREVAERYAGVLAQIDKHWQEHHAKTGEGTLPDPDEEQLRQVLYGDNISSFGPANVPEDQIDQAFDRDQRNKLQALQMKVKSFEASSPAAPPRAMVLNDLPNPVTPHVFKRGNPNTPGEETPRQFLAVVAGSGRKPFQKGSGRLELAQAIADRQNPLTARVMVNRVWLHHFGAPLVRTPGDFGLRSELPVERDLLDWLATAFASPSDPTSGAPRTTYSCGWQLKKLHRLIMLSNVYQERSDDNPASRKIDPDNSLLWRANRQRLDFEAMRDSVLAVSGKLDPTIGGRPVDLTAAPYPNRRSIYGFIDRQNLPNLFRTFDFASPDAMSPMRFVTTVPQQALFMMNSPFFVEQSRAALAARTEVVGAASDAQKIRELYRIVLGRLPEPDELALGLKFVANPAPPAEPPASAGAGPGGTPSAPANPAAKPRLGAWETYAQALLMTNEFLFVD